MRHLIGLGFRCDVAFQLRMHGRENVAHFFDWLAAPMEGVLKIIEADFDVFHSDHLELVTDRSPHCVMDRLTGVYFHHQFPLFAGHMQPDFLVSYEPFIRKFRYLAERFRNYLTTKPVTLVRQGITQEQAVRLEAAVGARFAGADVRFLYVLDKGEEFRTEKGHARLLKGDGSSLGDPGEWARMLAEEGLIGAPYRHATVEILGTARDDYNLLPDNRFGEAQLLVAMRANPRNAEFPLELSRWYMAKGNLKKAEEVAGGVLEGAPGNPRALFQATLMRWKTGRLGAEQAAEVFCGLAATEPPMASWLRETSAALLQAGRGEEACAYAVRAVMAAPLDPRNYLQKAVCLYRIKDFSRAELAMRAALKMGQGSQLYHHTHAKILDGLGRVAEAAEAERRALEASPGFFPSLFNRAGLLARLGRAGEALETYRAARRVAGEHFAAVDARIQALTGELPVREK